MANSPSARKRAAQAERRARVAREAKRYADQGDTVGLRIRATDSGREFFYIPGCAALPAEIPGRRRRGRPPRIEAGAPPLSQPDGASQRPCAQTDSSARGYDASASPHG